MIKKEQIEKIRNIAKGISILYVEDDLVIAHETQKLLKKIFSKVDYADNGQTAYELYKEKRHDLVMTDIRLPELNGISLAKQIKEINSEQPIIVVSAFNETKYFINMIQIGIDRFLLKPINMEQLIVTISKLVINIYNIKKNTRLEKTLEKKQKIKEILFQQMIVPMVIMDGNMIESANEKFYKYFDISRNSDLSKFELYRLFEDQDLAIIDNKKLIDTIEQGDNKIKHLYIDKNRKKTQRFVIKTAKVEDTDTSLICFLNFEPINTEIENLNNEHLYDMSTKFFTREHFITDIENLLEHDPHQYEIVCFSIAEIKKLIHRFSAESLPNIYKQNSKALLTIFANEIASKKISFYYLSFDGFVAIVENDTKTFLLQMLHSFSKEHKYIDPATQLSAPISFNTTSFTFEKHDLLQDIISRTEYKLFTLME